MHLNGCIFQVQSVFDNNIFFLEWTVGSTNSWSKILWFGKSSGFDRSRSRFLAETDQETNQDFWHGFIFVRVLYQELFDPKVLRCLHASHELNSLRMFLRYFLINNRQKKTWTLPEFPSELFQDQMKTNILKICQISVIGEVINGCNQTFMHFIRYKTAKQFESDQIAVL